MFATNLLHPQSFAHSILARRLLHSEWATNQNTVVQYWTDKEANVQDSNHPCGKGKGRPPSSYFHDDLARAPEAEAAAIVAYLDRLPTPDGTSEDRPRPALLFGQARLRVENKGQASKAKVDKMAGKGARPAAKNSGKRSALTAQPNPSKTSTGPAVTLSPVLLDALNRTVYLLATLKVLPAMSSNQMTKAQGKINRLRKRAEARQRQASHGTISAGTGSMCLLASEQDGAPLPKMAALLGRATPATEIQEPTPLSPMSAPVIGSEDSTHFVQSASVALANSSDSSDSSDSGNWHMMETASFAPPASPVLQPHGHLLPLRQVSDLSEAVEMEEIIYTLDMPDVYAALQVLNIPGQPHCYACLLA